VEQWKTPTYSEATHQLYVMVNLALGGRQSTDDTPNPSFLLVDYIRVYAPPIFDRTSQPFLFWDPFPIIGIDPPVRCIEKPVQLQKLVDGLRAAGRL
jgi:hypothetical protein